MKQSMRNRAFHPTNVEEFGEALQQYPRAWRTPDYTTIRVAATDIGLAWEERHPGGVPSALLAPDVRQPIQDDAERGPWQDMHRHVQRAVDHCAACDFELGALLRPSPWGGDVTVPLEELAHRPTSQGRLAARVQAALLSDETEAPIWRQRYQWAAFDLLWGLAVEGFGTNVAELRRPGLIGGASVTVGESSHVQLTGEGVTVRYGRTMYREDAFRTQVQILFPVHRALLPDRATLQAALPFTGREEPDWRLSFDDE